MSIVADPHFRVDLLSHTSSPNKVMYAALHQDYSENYVGDTFSDYGLPKSHYGKIVVERLLKGGKGHTGPIEHANMVMSVGYFPHSVMQQLTRHRLCSFDVQSLRYSGKRIAEFGSELVGNLDFGLESLLVEKPKLSARLEELFYFRPTGTYTDRQGDRYNYTESWRNEDILIAAEACIKYWEDLERGKSEEHARGLIPFEFRQHFVVSCNVRSFLHLMDLRSKKDAQLEAQAFCELAYPHLETICPEIAAWYKANRYGKAMLSP
jgi:thymidylate synthase (FAD)